MENNNNSVIAQPEENTQNPKQTMPKKRFSTKTLPKEQIPKEVIEAWTMFNDEEKWSQVSELMKRLFVTFGFMRQYNCPPKHVAIKKKRDYMRNYMRKYMQEAKMKRTVVSQAPVCAQ